jgi:hypothetical protein
LFLFLQMSAVAFLIASICSLICLYVMWYSSVPTRVLKIFSLPLLPS